MSDDKNINIAPEKGNLDSAGANITSSEVSSVVESAQTSKTTTRISSSSERQIKFERAQKCLENAALVSKRIKEHRKATAELLGRPFEDDDGGDTASEVASTMSERTGYSAATDSTALSVQDALNIPGISASLANTLKQKELLMERIKQYKEIGKRPIAKPTTPARRESITDSKLDIRKSTDQSEQLMSALKDKENALSVMQVKMRAMETTILDLQEKILEKDQVIVAKNKATTLISDSLSKKEKDTLSLLEDTRQQMIKMQENFITMENEWKEEKQRYQKDIEVKQEKIKSLEEANTILESSRFEISLEHSKLLEQLKVKNNEISQLEQNVQSLSLIVEERPSAKEKDDHDEEKGSKEIADMTELTKKIELLEQLNCQIRQANKELENKLTTMLEAKQAGSSPSKKSSPLPARKGGRNTASKMKSPWSHLSSESLPQESDKKTAKSEIVRLEMVVQSLNKEILDKEYENSQKDEIIMELKSLQTDFKDTGAGMVDAGTMTEMVSEPQTKTEKDEDTSKYASTEDHLSKDVMQLAEELRHAQEQITLLNNDIEAANKNMVKVKSAHKLKLKQMQKTIDNLGKVSDANAEIVRLNEELHQLSQKVAEVEEEKGNLQLHLVDYDSGRLTESDVYKKLVEMENLAETRLKAISSLETQKFDLVQELHTLQQKNLEIEDKLADLLHMQSEQVTTEMKSVQLEEQIDELIASKKELSHITENLKVDKEQLSATIIELKDERDDLNHKLENYIQENMDLTDRLEKLSAEKVSSAESIEIVESLTTQEKLELEEYNQGISGEKLEDRENEETDKNIENLIDQREELNKKIELFTQEREEVMEKMNKINAENESLHHQIIELSNQCYTLQESVKQCNKEKSELQELNQEINRHIEDLKRERIEIVKETAEIAKPLQEESIEVTAAEVQQDDKGTTSDKGINRTKSVKQLTKEILKLKNTIKEREAEIGDCQMKILSLEEQQQKLNEILKANIGIENKLKTVAEENIHLKGELDSIKADKQSEQHILEYKQSIEVFQQEIQKLQHDHAVTTSARDCRINELENILVEFEKQIFNYNNTLQQKDKDLTEYVNQISKLNDVSLKLKSTIETLEEEKAKDQNADLIKSLNKQIVTYQKKLAENEDKTRKLEDEKALLTSSKTSLENKNANLESELKRLQDTFSENQTLVKELQVQQQKHSEELCSVKLQTKDRDEEIHEVKLQLRKESIENEKLRNSLENQETTIHELTLKLNETEIQFNSLVTERNNLSQKLVTTEAINKEITAEKNDINEQFITMETKNKELLEKLKKFAVNIKKKSAMYATLENQLMESQKELKVKNEQQEQFSLISDTVPVLQDKLKHAEGEINRLQALKLAVEEKKIQEVNILQTEIRSLEDNLLSSSEEISHLKDSVNNLHKDLHLACEENTNLKTQLDGLNNKIVEHEIELRNSTNSLTKISSLEADINLKQCYISELLGKLESHEQDGMQTQYAHDAKIQERDLYIENMETEMNKYKNRICRLEESISFMEDSRHSLERKADQLDDQLQEKQKAYSEYTNQEDELVGRLAVLMDHDRVVEKQLHEIDGENKELKNKLQQINEENHRLRKSLSDIQEYCNSLTEKASKADIAESELNKYQSKLRDVEAHLKRVSQEQHSLIMQKQKQVEEIESEFNTQIENAFKEKKAIGEKYEKLIDRVNQLETKLQEYKTNNEHLSLNLQELNQINQALVEKTSQNDAVVTRDYTEQYINEINRLNAVINAKNQEVSDLVISIQELQSNQLSAISNFESKLSDLNHQLGEKSTELKKSITEADELKNTNEHLKNVLSQTEETLKELKDKKSLSFEMNIPKTEGMIISSRIEAVGEEPKVFDWSSLDSQIISDDTINQHIPNPPTIVEENIQKQSISNISKNKSLEQVITPKKAYLCYQTDSDVANEPDPFNSDEGWGLGECEEISEVTPGLSHLNEQIKKLMEENNALKSGLDASNVKLVKALRKLKELKSMNDMLTNEIKTSKQVSQSSFLDSAIEDELRLNINELEKKIEELTTDINKDKKDKESLRKQNEIFNNANDRLTEMKEKLENEIELWKYKFKDANDKISSLQWSADTKDSPVHKPVEVTKNVSNDQHKEEITKIEKENDELQQVVDELTSQNKELLNQQSHLKNELERFNNEVLQRSLFCENCDLLKSQISDLEKNYSESHRNIDTLNQKLRDVGIHCNEMTQNFEIQKAEHETSLIALQTEKQHLSDKCSNLEEETQSLRKSAVQNQKQHDAEIRCNEITQNFETLKTEHESLQITLQTEIQQLNDKCLNLEEEIITLRKSEVDFTEKNTSLLGEVEMLKTSLAQQNILQKTTDNHDMELLELATKYNTLEDHCSQLKRHLEEANNKIVILETNQNNELELPVEHSKQLAELNAKILNLNSENDNLLSTVTELRSSISSAVDQRGFEIAELWKQHLNQRENDFQKMEMELRSQINASEAKYEQLLDNMQSSSQEETNQMVMSEQVNSLQSKIKDKEEHLRDLQDKYADVVSQIDMLRSEMEDEKLTHENKILEQQEEYEKVIQDLNAKHKEQSDSYENTFKNVQADLVVQKAIVDELNQTIEDLTEKVTSSEHTIMELTAQLHMKDSVIHQKTNEFSIVLSQRNDEFENIRQQLIQYEKKIEDLSYEKESELAILRLKIHDNNSYYEEVQNDFEKEKTLLTEELSAKITECTNLNKQITDLNKTLEEDSSKLSELQGVLENQELEIVTLKDELDNLQSVLKVSAGKIQKHVSFASDTKLASDDEKEALNKELLEAVPKAELDLALYMLHQRDVKCEELTMELTQLLEERDTLQLRLSDSLRFGEELKIKCQSAGMYITDTSQEDCATVSELPSFSVEREQTADIHRHGSRTSSVSDPDGDKQHLQAKLSELRSVRQSRDVRLRLASEQRQLDMQLMHRDVALLPAEAVDQLTQAHHTLSRDSQSTSTVLLNWLRGKSTPKVLDM